MDEPAQPWLPRGFVHPDRVDQPTGHHLRPKREIDVDVDVDYLAVMGSRASLWASCGPA